jgi:hypothetical protein
LCCTGAAAIISVGERHTRRHFLFDGRLMANTWQGEFPVRNEILDGYEWTAPVGT